MLSLSYKESWALLREGEGHSKFSLIPDGPVGDFLSSQF